MMNILARSNRSLLEQFAWSNVLLAFDFDGTLAPIVSDPERAAMRRHTERLLRKLTELYPVAVISGRGQADVASKLRGVSVHQVVGNHGVEPWHASPRLSAEVRRWLPLLEERFATLKGVSIENKVFSLAIHYRHSREKRRVRDEIAAAARTLRDVRVIEGKQVVNLLPLRAPHKGFALERGRSRFGCDTAIFVGDDETDEDVFDLDQPGQLLSIRVGRSRTSAARFYVPSQSAIDELLRMLIDFRGDARHHHQAAQ
jgi:trehalose 6-phosphate phosphatase